MMHYMCRGPAVSNRDIDTRRLRCRKRLTHRVVAAAFFVLFATGLVFFTPALSGPAAGGWTRLVPRGAAVVIPATPVVYAAARPRSAGGRSGTERGL